MNQVVKSKGLMYGLILGFILALMTTYAYSVDLSFLVKPWLIVVYFFVRRSYETQLNHVVSSAGGKADSICSFWGSKYYIDETRGEQHHHQD